METLKPVDYLLEPDPRMAGFAAPEGLEKWHAQVARISLSPHVHEDVRSYFGTLQNMMLYGYFSEDLCAAAAFSASSAVELALRMKMPVEGQDKRGFWTLLDMADKNGLTAAFPGHLLKAVHHFRNANAHPKFRYILPPGPAITILNEVAEILNELFRPPGAPASTP